MRITLQNRIQFTVISIVVVLSLFLCFFFPARQWKQIQDSLWNVRLTAIFVSLIALFFGSLGALWLARSVFRPILSICNAAESVGASDLNLRVEIASNDELGKLGKAFNKMVEDIRRYLEVLEWFDRMGADVVLMDVQMPEMDGLQATRSILARYEAAARPYIIGLTANATVEDRQRALNAGMDDYLSKPVRPQDLADALADAAAWKTRRDGISNPAKHQ